jgi:hypothetical protein
LFGGGQQGGVQQASRISPQQQNILSMLMNMSQQGMQNPYEGFEPIARRARSQFNQQTVPSLAERFTSMGSNALSSPAFASQLGQAGAGLDEGLAALQSQYGMENKQNIMRMLALALSPYFENFYQQRQPGFGENLLTGAIGALPSFAQSYQMSNALKALQG